MNVPMHARWKTQSAKIHACQLQSVTSVIVRWSSVLMLVPVEVNALAVAMAAKIKFVECGC